MNASNSAIAPFDPSTDSATAIAADVRSGRRSASDVVERSLARITEINSTINAFNVVLADEARAAARAIDDTPSHERGPLAGVPIGVKAEIAVAGQVTTFGGRANITPAQEDSEVVRRLRAAGAVIVGVTNMPEFGEFPFTEPAAFGATRNPWALDRSPGGSSGGSAAAVASGCVPVAIGGDGGGSIRIPASTCGLVGLKPARGRVSTAPMPDLWGTLGTTGPLTRTAADSALVYDVLAGTVAVDRWHAPAPAQPYSDAIAEAHTLPRKRIALLLTPATPNVRVEREVRQALETLADTLRALGHDVESAPGRWPDVTAAFVPQFFDAIRSESRLVEHPDRLELRTRRTAQMGVWARGGVVRGAVKAGEKARRDFQARFAGFDAVLSPTLPVLPPRLGQLDAAGTVRALLRALPMTAFTSHANVTGLPAISVPAGLGTQGLPIGAQLSGLVEDEGVLLALAAQLEQTRGA